MWKMRKKIQKLINKHTRALNKNLLNDPLWKGRFYVHQVDANWEEYQDGSGGELRCLIEIRDKKTGKYHGFKISNYGIGYDLWSECNDFIINSGVWEDIEVVKNDKTNWSKVKWKPIKEVH